MKTHTHAVVIQVPVEAIDLAHWIFTMTEEDYRACSRGHEAMGAVGAELRLGLVNVETIAGTLLVQHYRTQEARRDHVSFLSKASTGFLMHLIPFAMTVTWEMWAAPCPTGGSAFRCTIGYQAPAWVTAAGMLIANDFWVKRHLVGETEKFALDLERKVMRAGSA